MSDKDVDEIIGRNIIAILVRKLCPTVMPVRKLLCWGWDGYFRFGERENEVCVIEDAYRWWHQEEKLCTSKISSLVEKLFTFKISRLVEKLCPTRMLVRKLLCWWWWILVLVREKWSLLHWICSESCFDVTSRSETTHLTRVSRLASDDDIKKINSAKRLVWKLCSTVMLVIKLMC